MNVENIAKGAQEQATAAWIECLNQIRIDKFITAWNQQNQNKADAMKELEEALKKINEEIIERNRGSSKGMHGFIAEVAECGITNARHLIIGEDKSDKWLNNNGPADIARNGQPLQLKFYEKNLSLDGVKKHLDANPGFIKKENGKYVVAKDQYDQIKHYLSMPKVEAGKLTKHSYREWQQVQKLFSDEGEMSLDDLEPSVLDYDEVQANQIENTIECEKKSLNKVDRKERDRIQEESQPSVGEALKTAGIAAAAEGCMALAAILIEKRRSGKKFSDFDKNDWIEIAEKTGVGAGKGAFRSFSIYTLTNCTAAPSSVANAAVTASFGVAEQAHLFRTGQIEEKDFIENSEFLCIDATVSALSSMIGQVAIPIPILGSVIGNAVGTFLYQTVKDNLSQIEESAAAAYLEEIYQLNARLADVQQEFIQQLNENLVSFMNLLSCAFSPDPTASLIGSAELACEVGVPAEEILDTQEKINSYFLD